MADEGQFRYTNGTVIDGNLSSSRVDSVINHEFVHSQLYSMTTYGQMMMMLEKNSWLHEKSKEFLDVLFSFMNRMSERTAVNAEFMKEYIDNGMESYQKALEELREKNTLYYNYFRKLCCINGKINCTDDAKKLLDILLGIAKLALNVNLEYIPLEKIENSRMLKKYFSDSCNGPCISPNKRFDILVNVLFRNNSNNNDIKSVIEGSIPLERIDDVEYIHQIAYKKVSKMLNDSNMASRLIKRIESVGAKYFTPMDGIECLSAKPALINVKKELLVKPVKSIEEFIKLYETEKVKELFVAHCVGGFEEVHVISIYGKKDTKNIMYSLYLVGEKDFFNLLSNMECNFVFYKTKLIGNIGKEMRKMVRRLPIYIFEDSPIIASLDFIKIFFYKGKFGFIENERHSILVVTKKSFVLSANVVANAVEPLVKELSENGLIFEADISKLGNVEEIIRINNTCNEYEVNLVDDAELYLT